MLDKGIYRLTEDVTNPHPDRRKRYDWRAMETWRAGQEFEVIETRVNAETIALAIGPRQAQWTHYFYQHEWQFFLLAEKLERVTDVGAELDAYFTECGAYDQGWRIALRLLVSQGTVTLDDAKAALKAAVDSE
jgi:hypothetical protein